MGSRLVSFFFCRGRPVLDAVVAVCEVAGRAARGERQGISALVTLDVRNALNCIYFSRRHNAGLGGT